MCEEGPGGRRCPSHDTEEYRLRRNARRREAYAAKIADLTGREVEQRTYTPRARKPPKPRPEPKPRVRFTERETDEIVFTYPEPVVIEPVVIPAPRPAEPVVVKEKPPKVTKPVVVVPVTAPAPSAEIANLLDEDPAEAAAEIAPDLGSLLDGADEEVTAEELGSLLDEEPEGPAPEELAGLLDEDDDEEEPEPEISKPEVDPLEALLDEETEESENPGSEVFTPFEVSEIASAFDALEVDGVAAVPSPELVLGTFMWAEAHFEEVRIHATRRYSYVTADFGDLRVIIDPAAAADPAGRRPGFLPLASATYVEHTSGGRVYEDFASYVAAHRFAISPGAAADPDRAAEYLLERLDEELGRLPRGF